MFDIHNYKGKMTYVYYGQLSFPYSVCVCVCVCVRFMWGFQYIYIYVCMLSKLLSMSHLGPSFKGALGDERFFFPLWGFTFRFCFGAVFK